MDLSLRINKIFTHSGTRQKLIVHLANGSDVVLLLVVQEQLGLNETLGVGVVVRGRGL
jgi:hypothetical protein